jgi:hypothetical protein
VTAAYVAQGMALQRSELVDGWGVLVLAS